jgi:hypothetical protein
VGKTLTVDNLIMILMDWCCLCKPSGSPLTSGAIFDILRRNCRLDFKTLSGLQN